MTSSGKKIKFQSWRDLSITAKFNSAFGILLALIGVVAVTGYISLTLVRKATKTNILVSTRIQRLVLEIDRGMHKARLFQRDFFLFYPQIDFEKAQALYTDRCVRQIDAVFSLSNELKQLIDASQVSEALQNSDVNLNLFLLSAQRFSETFTETVDLVTQLATPETGLLAQLAQHSASLKEEVAQAGEPRLMDLYRDMLLFEKEFRITQQRPLMQSAFNVAFHLRRAIANSPALDSDGRTRAQTHLDHYVSTAQAILRLDVAIRDKFSDFALQAETIDPISQELIALSRGEVDRALDRIARTDGLAKIILIVAALVGLLLTAAIAQLLNSNITRNVVRLTQAASEFQAGNLTISTQIDTGDELGQLAASFNAMASRIQMLVTNLEQKVDERTAELTVAKEILQESEERYRSIFENAVEGIFQATPGAIGRFISANPAHARILGYDSAEQMMAEVNEIGPRFWVDPQDRKAFSEQVSKGAVTNFETRLRRRDGRLIWVSLNAGPVLDASGKLDYIEGIMLDITDRKRAEEKLNQYREHLEELVRGRTVQLEAANKELEAFAYSVSHDLRAPLRHIEGFLELLEKRAGIALDAQNRHYMDIISDSAKKMGLLIDDLLSFSRMGRNAMSIRPLELAPLVRDVIRELEPDTAGRTIDWRIGDLPAVEGDASMLRIVLGNLIANALKFTRTRQKARIEIGPQPGRDSETVIYVRDNGVGFDMTFADKLFGVFQRLHRADEFEGTGIGLANVRRIIARHGGRTWAKGKVDQGATFYFSLPHKLKGDRGERL